MNSLARALKRFTAVGLSAAVILLSAGMDAYAAAGRSTQVQAVPVVSATVAVSPLSLKTPAFNTALPGGNLGQSGLAPLTISINGAAGQNQVPAVGASAHPGAASQIKLSATSVVPGAVSAGKTAGLAPATASAESKTGAPATAGAALESTAASIEQGRTSQAVRLGRVIRAAASIFGDKKDGSAAAPVAGSLGAGSAPLAAATTKKDDGAKTSTNIENAPLGDNADTPVPPKNNDGGDGNDGDGGGKKWGGLGKAAAAFIGALLVMQVGVEALSASMPTLVQKAFGDFTVVAQLAIFSSIASIIGRQIGPIFIKKHGLRKVYLVSQLARLISISVLCALLATGTMTLPLMMGMYSLNGLLGGVAMTAEQSIPTALIGQDQKKIEKFWTIEQTLLEIVGVSAPIITGMVVASMGFLPALIAYPVAFGIALLILFKSLRIPQKIEAMRLADLDKAKAEGKTTSAGGVFKAFFQRIAHGAKLVWKNPALKYSFLAYTAYMALNPFLYSILGPAYALRIVDNPELATSVAGWLTGFYSLGGLLGGLIMIWESKKLDKTKPTPEQETAALRASMLKWMKWGTVGLLAIGTLAFPSPMFLGTLTLPALALIPFGIAQVISFLKLKSFFQSKVPAGEMADAMGFFGAASLAVSTVGLLALKYLFKGLPGFTPFWWIAAAMIPTAALYIWLTRKMAKASEPETKK